jgi:hypothetical protein
MLFYCIPPKTHIYTVHTTHCWLLSSRLSKQIDNCKITALVLFYLIMSPKCKRNNEKKGPGHNAWKNGLYGTLCHAAGYIRKSIIYIGSRLSVVWGIHQRSWNIFPMGKEGWLYYASPLRAKRKYTLKLQERFVFEEIWFGPSMSKLLANEDLHGGLLWWECGTGRTQSTLRQAHNWHKGCLH